MSFAFWLNAKGGLRALIQGRPRARTQERQTERDAKVARVEIFPKNVTVDLDGRVRFSAIAYDGNDHPVGGVKINWHALNVTLARRAPISDQGEFRATTVGSFSISAEANGRTTQVNLIVRPGVRLNPSLPPIRTRPVSTRAASSERTSATATSHPLEIAARFSNDRRVSNRGRAMANRSHTYKPPATAPMLPDAVWDDTNYWSADDPNNGVGNTPGGPLDGGAGSGNFQFAAPIYGAAGRGINISLGAAYNSRLWNKAGNQITYDIDRGWPAPGWSLGFGKMLGMGVNNGGMLIDADGTRHAYTGNITFYSWGTQGVLHTTDGSFIDYTYQTGTGGSIGWAEATLANGTYVLYGAPGPGAVYPTFIRDANGNYINITYVNDSGPRIQTVSDTLGRVITFHYDSNNLLTAITGPGLDGDPVRTLVRLHYQQLGLNYGFSGLTPVVRDANPWVIDAIYYPATNTGYWFGDSNSYSSYGMISKVVEQRGMGFSAAPLNEQGPVTQGSVSRRETYSYPLTPDNTLTDAPTYASMNQEWTRDGVNFDSATTGYEVNQNSTPRTTTITLPNGLKSTQYSYNYTSLPDSNPLKALDGLVYLDETYVTPGNILQSSTSTWEKGAYDTPRPLRVEKIDERGQKTAAEFSYGSVYNQVIEVRDYDYGGTPLLRATRTTYQNGSNYISRHIFNLPLTVEIFDPNNVRVSRTEYQYDGQTLTNAPSVVHHLPSYNPHAPTEMVFDCWPLPHNPDIEICEERPFNPYNPATAYRGDLTQITTFANAATEPATIPLVETRHYDITGNMVTASSSCCEQTSFNYTVDTQYAYPQSQTRGSATDPYVQVTTSATYDFNIGLTLSATDANDREAQTEYDAATLRPTKATLPTGAHTHYFYDDLNMEVTTKTYLGAHAPTETAIADQNVKRLNGNGQVRHEKARGPDNPNETWDAVDTIYNNLGQVEQQSRPYREGGASPVFSTATYDVFGRTKTVTAPDGSVTETFYNEPTRPDVASSEPGETTRVRDAWGRERWGRTDASGHLVEVVEPNPNGDGTVATGGLVTRYTYNTLASLVTINSMAGSQVQQTRSFKYDSLGRLLAQKLAETSATIDDSGAYVGVGGPGAQWGEYFRYENAHSNMVQRLDARGVKTNYWYFNPAGHTDPGDGTTPDPLGRLQSVSWDTSVANQNLQPTDPNYVLSAAPVSYKYRTKSSPSDLIDIAQSSSVIAAGVSTESYGYDTEGRVSSKTLTLTSRSTFPFETNYSYDALDRVTDVLYPKQYGNGSAPRKMVHHDYDNASRLSGLTYDGQSFASNIVYNAASQTTSLSVGTGANQITESYNYNSQTGLLDNQTVARGATTLLDLSYDYANASGKRTGQLTKILNNLNPNKDRGYSYDALGRLVQASGGINGTLWTQTYSYDRYGNRTSVTASGYSAKSETTGSGASTLTASRSQRRTLDMSESLAAHSIPQPSEPRVDLPTDLLARNNRIELPPFLRDDSKPLSDSPPTLYAAAAPQSGSSKIAFASNRDGSLQIYLMNTDGTDQTRLTNNAGNDDAPRWSPNNSKILFQSDRDTPFCAIFDIYTMNADGSGQTRLTTDINDDSAPVWSPDGTKIAFQSMRNGAKYQIYVMNSDGSGQTNISNSAANDTQPSWSPDGTKIAFSSDRDSSTGQSDIYVMNSNGSNQTRLTFTNDPFTDSQPAWSVDGLKLAFASTRDSTIDTWTETDDFEIPEDDGQVFPRSRVNINNEVYVMNADGSGQTRLTNTLENDETPAWSGDGSKIVFRSDRERDNYDPVAQVWVMNPDGTAQANISNNECGDFCPSWQNPPSNLPPTVSITAPANGAGFTAPANINITANASDSDGTVTRVDFYQGTTLIGTDMSAPYSFSWNNVAAGSYSLTAKATDNGGATTTSATVNINLNAPPTVSVTSPANGATFTAPASITISANASDSDGTISSVQFFHGTTLIGTDTSAPYSFSWNNVAAGSYSLTAKATDNGGATTTSATVNINLNAPPTVGVTSPANGATFTAPASITISANASDSDGSISSVEFFHGTTSIGTDTSAPYSVSWNNVAAGNYSLTARATDNSGATTTSAGVNVTVNANGAPTVSITAPANGASFTTPANVNITANATDSDGTISSVEFYQGTSLLGSDTTAPYSFSWNNVAAGSYSLTAKATDNGGSTTTSSPVSITVNPDQPPTVSITGPANGATFTAPASINITANASDNDGTISGVEFYQGTTLIGTDATAPYTLNWNNVAAGSYSLTVKATDNAGGMTTSEPVSITVNAAPVPIPPDGHASISYDTASNRIITDGFAYDAAGNQVRALIPGGSGSQHYRYDAANRLVQVRTDDNNTIIATYSYGDSNERLIAEEGSRRTYYACDSSAEYVEDGASITPAWSKTYVHLAGRLLSTLTPNGSGGEAVEYHHPDRLGTRLISNPSTGAFFEQQTLPFGTALNESPAAGGTFGETNRRFTSYDRSQTTKLDFAVNRHYDSQQGRFTQVDPIGMSDSDLTAPQSLNLYAYCMNDPVNHADPTGLGFLSFLKKIGKAILKVLKNKWVQIAIAVAIILIAHYYPHSIFGAIGGGSNAGAAAPVAHGAGATTGLATAGGGALAGASAGVAAGLTTSVATSVYFSTVFMSAAVASSGIATAVSLGLAGALAAGQIGGAFTPAQQTEVNNVKNKVRQRLQNPKCANVLGGLRKAMALFNRARVLHANNINPAFGGSARIYRGVARQAFNLAQNQNSNILAWSEIGGKYIYLNDRFFTYFPLTPSKEETVFIHELHRLGGFRGTDKADYAKIIKGCGTADPYVP